MRNCEDVKIHKIGSFNAAMENYSKTVGQNKRNYVPSRFPLILRFLAQVLCENNLKSSIPSSDF